MDRKPNPSSRSPRTNYAGLYVSLEASRIMGLHPRRAPIAKVARTDAITAGAGDTSWNSSCGATPEAV